jgi:hypothetical protein
MAQQRFQLQQTAPGLPAEMVCAGCQAGMVMDEDAAGGPAGALVMEHAPDCPEVRRMAGQQA